MRPLNDNEHLPSSSEAVGHRELHELAEHELPEWLQAQQDDARERESEDRFKLGVALLVVMVTGLMAIQAIATYPGGLG